MIFENYMTPTTSGRREEKRFRQTPIYLQFQIEAHRARDWQLSVRGALAQHCMYVLSTLHHPITIFQIGGLDATNSKNRWLKLGRRNYLLLNKTDRFVWIQITIGDIIHCI